MPTTLIINTIGTQTAGVPFVITGSYQLPTATYTANLEFEDNGGAFTPIPVAAVTATVANWTDQHDGGLSVGAHTVSVKDPFSGEVVVSNSFNVIAGNTIAVTHPTVTAGSTWTLAGTLGGYSVKPALSYRLDGAAAVTIPPADVTTTTFSLPGLLAPGIGAHVVTVSDGTVTSPPSNFNVVSPTGVITVTAPGAEIVGVPFVLSGTTSGYLAIPTLTYLVDNSTSATPITGNTLTQWSVTVILPSTGSHVIKVTDGTSNASTTITVNAANGTITAFVPNGITAGQSFTFTGVMAGYATIPSLTYTILPGGSPVPMTGVSTTGWAMTVTVGTAGAYTISVTDGTVTSPSVAFSVAQSQAPTILRNWFQEPGMDNSFWVKPFQNSANWITSGALVTALRSGTPSINQTGNFAPPWYIGQHTDPQVTVTDGTHSIVVHIPLGAIVEGPSSAVDQSIGGSDATQPYLVWSISAASINTGSVAASGSVIRGNYGFAVQDGSGLMMVDAVTGAPGDNNSFGNIQDYELSKLSADPNYVVQHMLACQLDIGQSSSAGPIWPLLIIDGGAVYTGSIPQGCTFGIPFNVQRPLGKTRGFYALWDICQQFGLFTYNFGAVGGINLVVNSFSGAYASLVADIVAQWPSVAANLCILNYANGVSGAQYSLATTKGAIAGSSDAYPSPPPLDLSPTNNLNVAPASFGAWYPSGYNAIPTNTTGGGGGVVFAITPTAPFNAVKNVQFTFKGTLSGYSAIPTLTYSVNGAAPVALSGVTTTGWSQLLTLPASGQTTIVVTDSVHTVSGSTTFTVLATAPTSTPVTWNPSDLAGPVTLSNNNYTATAGGSATPYGSPQGVRATIPLNAGTILAWEVGFTQITQNTAIGITDGNHVLTLTGGMGSDTDSIGAYASTGTGSQPAGTVYNNNNQLTVGNGQATVAGGVMSCIANGTGFYFSTPAMRSTSGVMWNNSATADPVQGIGGLSFAGMASPYYITFETGEAGAVVVLNDGSLGFSAFLSTYIAANPSVVAVSGQTQVLPSKQIVPNIPVNPIVGSAFSFSGSLIGYATAPSLVYSINNAPNIALTGVTSTGWSANIVSSAAGSNTIKVSDGTINGTVTFNVATTSGGGSRVSAPLTGSVTKGSWIVANQTLANSPSGRGSMQYNVLLPAQYNTGVIYPVLHVAHPDFDGMNGSSYPRDAATFVTGTAYLGGTQSLDSLFNNVAFRTAFPCIIVACQCDQTLGDSNANGNFGGYNDAQNSGWNENAVNAAMATVKGTYSCDFTRFYCIGYSLGAIGSIAWLVDNNIYSGPGLKLWAAGAGFSDQLFRPGTANASVFSRMSQVPYFAVSTTSDNVPTSYDTPAWQAYTGNSNYPSLSTYQNGGMAAVRAASTLYYYVNNGSGQPDGCLLINALGGIGTAFFNWLFAVIAPGGGSSNPVATLSGITISAHTSTANAAVGTSVGVMTATSSTTTAPVGAVFTISSQSTAGAFKVTGSTLQVANGALTAGAYTVQMSVTATNATNSPQVYTISVTVSAASARFTITGGHLFGPSGAQFKGGGINITEDQLSTAVTNSACQPMTTLFPGINIVRLACHSFVTVAQVSPFVNACTAIGIVVEIEDHQWFNANGSVGGTAGGGQGVVLTGSALANESAWYAMMAAAFAGNPRVWFGTNNEPSVVDPNTGQTNVGLLSAWHLATYNAIRGAGNNNPVCLCLNSPNTFGTAGGMNKSSYANMTNVMWDCHWYNWVANYSTSVSVIQTSLNNTLAPLGTITSLDGVIPTVSLEYGNSTNGSTVDAGGTQTCQVIQSAVGTGQVAANAAWIWDNFGTGAADQLRVGSSNTLSAYGQQIATWIATGTSGPA